MRRAVTAAAGNAACVSSNHYDDTTDNAFLDECFAQYLNSQSFELSRLLIKTRIAHLHPKNPSPIMETIKKAIGSAFDPNTDIPDLSGKVRFFILLVIFEC